MKIASVLMLTLASCLSCAALDVQIGIGDIALRGCSTAQRGKLDKATVAAFLNNMIQGPDSSLDALKPNEIQLFKWVDLAGNGKCELVLTVSTGPNYVSLWIYWQNHAQTLPGGANLKEGIRDLDGDGKKEIILYSSLDPAGGRGGNPTPVWPRVFRLEGEKYVPASWDFPGIYDFYQREVLPQLNEEMDKKRRILSPDFVDNNVAVLEMQRDKILRFLRLDPQAGLEEARQWAKSNNPDMIYNAWCVFQDIPGHEAEANAAKQAEQEAFRRRVASAP
ncbi:MAG TPA: hypothetical protein VKV05_06140 [Terriglobales bacterium]|nr:hypothetical protein [Terriglobales bacterium]